MRRPVICALLVMIALSSACSLRKAGLARMADAISATTSTFATDNDPEFVRVAAPATLKMVEMLLQEQPRHHGLLATGCSGFTQYAYAFLQVDAEGLGPDRAEEARELRRRAGQMYDRARDYCLRALDTRISGIGSALPTGKTELLQRTDERDVPVLFWLGASWGGSLSVSAAPALRIGEIPTLRSVLQRALQLDPDWESGAIHEALIALEGLPAMLGGSPERAKQHFEKAMAMSKGQSAFAYVTYATSVAQPARDRAEFERLLKAALAIDAAKTPALRLPNLIAQKRARQLLARANILF